MFQGHQHFPHQPFIPGQPPRPGQPGFVPGHGPHHPNHHQVHPNHHQIHSIHNQNHQPLINAQPMQSSASFASSTPTLVSSQINDADVEPPPETSIHPRVIRGWADGMQARMANVNALAVVATFLAAVQAQLISFTYQNNETTIQRAVNALFFLGMSFDIIGTAMGLVSALTMQPDQQSLNQAVLESTEAYAEWVTMGRELAELELQDKMSSGRSIPMHMMNERMAQQRHFMQRSHVIGLKKKSWIAQDEARSAELEELRRSLVIGNIKGLAPLVIMGCGILCFFVGLICFVVDTQPAVVWGTTTAAIALGASVLPIDALLHSRHTRARFAKPLKTLKRRVTGNLKPISREGTAVDDSQTPETVTPEEKDKSTDEADTKATV